MTSRPPRLALLEVPGTVPFGAAHAPELEAGVDLAARGFREDEYLLRGSAATWRLSETPGSPERLTAPVPYTTRLLMRRPVDPDRASGTVHLEPLHPHRDGGLTWRAAAELVLREGHAWVGVTVFAHQVQLLRERLAPARYEALDLPPGGLEWDVLGQAATAIRALPDLRADRILLSGWSATGSVVRVFLREGFAARHAGAIDGAVAFISSGGAGPAGYPGLSPDDPGVPLDDPRRTLRDVGVPVFEVLSETEAETHEAQTRDDSDEPDDRYRLYEVAATAHIEPWNGEVLTNSAMLEAVGMPSPDPVVQEELSDARLDLVARAALTRLDDWIATGTAPPRGDRFEHTGAQRGENRDLARDADGIALGGIRTPWAEAPLAAYRPHATAVEPEGAFGAFLTGVMTRFPADEVRRRYGDEQTYRARFTAATEALVAAGLLLAEDAAELLAAVPGRWAAATR